MKIPPKKPHFFKPILPGFKNGLKIPIGFLKYLKGQEHVKRAVLKRVGKKWRVKVNDKRFKSGWREFVEENDVQLGEMLVFRHEGNMEFEVSIFDSSHCDREYAEYLLEGGGGGASIEEISKKFEFKEAASDNPCGQSHVVCLVRAYCLSRCYFRLPGKFSRANGLINKNCGLIIRDEKRRSWILKLYTSCSQVYIGGRWTEFRDANDIKEGDHITFKVVANGEMPIWKFHKKSNRNIMSSHEDFPNIEDAKDIPLSNPYFVCTLKPSYLSKCSMRVPVSFARLNGLSNRKCTITIRDKRRSWTFRLSDHGMITYIGGGWRKFCMMNCLKEGDYLVFEILANGEKPILMFHDMRGNASPQHEGKKINLDAKRISTKGLKIKTSYVTALKEQGPASTSANDVNPHFISIIKPYYIKHYLYIPLAFAKSNGWMNRRREMILMDEQRRSWSVQLGPVSEHQIGILSGWQNFREANDVQVGDIYRFELINNEEIPMAYFHRKYSVKEAKQSPCKVSEAVKEKEH